MLTLLSAALMAFTLLSSRALATQGIPPTTLIKHTSTTTMASTSSMKTTTSSLLPSSAVNEIQVSLSLSASLPVASDIISSVENAVGSLLTPTIPFLRGVNLGGWLVLESWMDGDLFSGNFENATDQYSFDSLPGAKEALEEHWSTYFVESDIAALAAAGINALRIPIGFWAYDNANTPYIQGADEYMDLAITWARKYGMKVWVSLSSPLPFRIHKTNFSQVDCHGSPGSQNGFQNSGHAKENNGQLYGNLDRSIEVLKIMGAKYGSWNYSDVVVGLELVNEPIARQNNVFSTTQLWAQEAYLAVRSVVANPFLVIVMHDSFQTPLEWLKVGKLMNGLLLGGLKNRFGIDTHKYGLYSAEETDMNQAQHIDEVCGTWPTVLAPSKAIMPTYVGEWSAITQICVIPDGSTTAGSSCDVDGCQCQDAGMDNWNDAMVEWIGKFVEAQLDVFEENTHGYFMWAAKGNGGWGFLNGIEKGIIPNPVTSRNYKPQCGSSSKRREVRGSLGRDAEQW
jgi:glucan 1,3-beta-glucosidase